MYKTTATIELIDLEDETLERRTSEYIGENLTQEMGNSIANALGSIVSPWGILTLANAVIDMSEDEGIGWDESTKECLEAEQLFIDAASKLIDWWNKRGKKK